MKRLAKPIAVLALLWSLAAPALVYFREIRDEHTRKLNALAGSRLGASADDMTNEVVRVSLASVEMVHDLAEQHRRRSHFFETVLLASSAVTAVLAFVVLTRKHEHPTA